MIKRISNILSNLKWTVAGGVLLAASLIMMLADIAFPVDPAWLTIMICGTPIVYSAVTKLILKRSISSSLLISIAMVASIAIGELFAAGEVAFIMAIGAILEDKTVERAKKGIKQLISLAPKHGRKITDGEEQLIPVEMIARGDIVRVVPGEAVPVDGEIVSGNTSVDQSIITGESLPVDKAAGDQVFCGTINRFGAIDIRATKVGKDSSLAKLIRLVRQAQDNKAPMQRTVDRWAAWLVPTALVIAIITLLVTKDITRAVTVLVVFCPCALALATPTSIMAAIGQAAKHGVIIKSGDALERMGKADVVAFDKTGTLTYGNLAVSDVVSFNAALSGDDVLSLAASAESFSEHPLGKAIVAHAKEQRLTLRHVEDFEMIPGKGVAAKVDGRKIVCGSSDYLEETGVVVGDEVYVQLGRIRGQGKAAIVIADGTACVGLVALSDTVREFAKDMVSELKAIDTGTVLLTGDHEHTAKYIAGQLGITDVYAGLLPEQKVGRIEQLEGAGKKICMIGDGVNDAPALKTAYVGVAMGGMGSDIAVEAADVALMGDDISKIPYLKRLSNATIKLIKFNITLAMLINFIAIILSTLALLNPLTGALVHNIGAVLVVLNAALLYDRKYI